MDANRFLVISKNDINASSFTAPYRTINLPPCKGFWARQIACNFGTTNLALVGIDGLAPNPFLIANDCNTAMVDIYVKTTQFLTGAVIFKDTLTVKFYNPDGSAKTLGANDHFGCLIEFDY